MIRYELCCLLEAWSFLFVSCKRLFCPVRYSLYSYYNEWWLYFKKWLIRLFIESMGFLASHANVLSKAAILLLFYLITMRSKGRLAGWERFGLKFKTKGLSVQQNRSFSRIISTAFVHDCRYLAVFYSPLPPTPTPSTRKPTKTKQMTEASALVCLILTTALVFVVCLTDVWWCSGVTAVLCDSEGQAV